MKKEDISFKMPDEMYEILKELLYLNQIILIRIRIRMLKIN